MGMLDCGGDATVIAKGWDKSRGWRFYSPASLAYFIGMQLPTCASWDVTCLPSGKHVPRTPPPGLDHSSDTSLRQVTLHLQPPAWGLPTARPDFLHVLTYCKLADVNFAVVPESSFGGSAMADGKGDIPIMHTEQNAVAGANNIVKSLQDEGRDLDATLSPQERAETYAFIALLQGTLQTAMDCEWYLNDTNWFEVVKVTRA